MLEKGAETGQCSDTWCDELVSTRVCVCCCRSLSNESRHRQASLVRCAPSARQHGRTRQPGGAPTASMPTSLPSISSHLGIISVSDAHVVIYARCDLPSSCWVLAHSFTPPCWHLHSQVQGDRVRRLRERAESYKTRRQTALSTISQRQAIEEKRMSEMLDRREVRSPALAQLPAAL